MQLNGMNGGGGEGRVSKRKPDREVINSALAA